MFRKNGFFGKNGIIDNATKALDRGYKEAKSKGETTDYLLNFGKHGAIDTFTRGLDKSTNFVPQSTVTIVDDVYEDLSSSNTFKSKVNNPIINTQSNKNYSVANARTFQNEISAKTAIKPDETTINTIENSKTDINPKIALSSQTEVSITETIALSGNIAKSLIKESSSEAKTKKATLPDDLTDINIILESIATNEIPMLDLTSLKTVQELATDDDNSENKKAVQKESGKKTEFVTEVKKDFFNSECEQAELDIALKFSNLTPHHVEVCQKFYPNATPAEIVELLGSLGITGSE